MNSGRTSFLTHRRKTDYSLIKQILASEPTQKTKQIQNDQVNDSNSLSSIIIDGNNNSDDVTRPIRNDPNDIFTVDLTTPTDETNKTNDIRPQTERKTVNHDGNLSDLLNQVAELDQIYSDNQTRLNNMETVNDNVRDPKSMEVEDFDERNTYSSLQLAFKNPVPIAIPDLSYEDVITQKGPIIELTPLKRDTEEKLPPLPPKRIKKAPSIEVLRPRAQTVSTPPDEHSPKFERANNSMLSNDRVHKTTVTRSVDRLSANLPAIPPKKKSFLSRIFNRKQKEKSPPRADGKLNNKSVGRSASSVSGQRPARFKQETTRASLKGSTGNLSLGTSLRYTDSITHISLHGDDNHNSSASLNNNNNNHLMPLLPTSKDTILVAENVLAIDASALKKLQDNLDLTEAEHYALYMALAPHATASEFDELSCYYSPVEGGKIPLTAQPSRNTEI